MGNTRAGPTRIEGESMKIWKFLKRNIVVSGATLMALAAFMASARSDSPVDTSHLTLVGIAEANGTTYASLVDAQTGKHFIPSSRSADNGLELVSVREGEDAVIRQNGQSFVLKLGWPDGTGSEVNDVPRPEASPIAQYIPRPGTDPNAPPTPPPGEKLPLVFQARDLSSFDLTDAQKGIISRLRQQFVAAVSGGAGSAGSSAAVLAGATVDAAPDTVTPVSSPPVAPPSAADPIPRWESAQEQSDDIFKMLFGYQAFNAYEMNLHRSPPLN